MAREILDTTGIEWSQVISTIASKVACMQPGDILEMTGAHPSFEQVILTWCERVKKKMIAINPGR